MLVRLNALRVIKLYTFSKPGHVTSLQVTWMLSFRSFDFSCRWCEGRKPYLWYPNKRQLVQGGSCSEGNSTYLGRKHCSNWWYLCLFVCFFHAARIRRLVPGIVLDVNSYAIYTINSIITFTTTKSIDIYTLTFPLSPIPNSSIWESASVLTVFEI